MILHNYSIALERLDEKHLEMLRNWRNAPAIVRQMEFKEYITREMQIQWFRTVDNVNNFYFMIRFEGDYQGLIHLSHLDFDQRTAQAGLFISNPAYLLTSLPARASVTILDFAFLNLRLKSVSAKVRKGNEKAISYNEHLGFTYWKEADHPDFFWLQLTQNAYFEEAGYLRTMVEKLYGNQPSITWNKELPGEAELSALIALKCAP